MIKVEIAYEYVIVQRNRYVEKDIGSFRRYL